MKLDTAPRWPRGAIRAVRGEPLPPDMCFFGEVGLGGELRPVMQSERRIAEAATMGFRRVLLPEAGSDESTEKAAKKNGVELVRCKTMADALQAALDVRPTRYAAKSHPNGSWPSKIPRKKKSGASRIVVETFRCRDFHSFTKGEPVRM